MKNSENRIWAASLLLTGALVAGGTLAYLTDKDSVTNQSSHREK